MRYQGKEINFLFTFDEIYDNGIPTGRCGFKSFEFEGDFYAAKHGHSPIVVYANKHISVQDTFQFPGSDKVYYVDEVEAPPLKDCDYILLVLVCQDWRSGKSIGYLADDIYERVQLFDEEGGCFCENLKHLSENGRDAFILGFSAAKQQCLELLNNFVRNED